VKGVVRSVRNFIITSRKTQGLALTGVGLAMFAATSIAEGMAQGATRELAHAAVIVAGLLSSVAIFRRDAKGPDLG
jgi:hypothetical protein